MCFIMLSRKIRKTQYLYKTVKEIVKRIVLRNIEEQLLKLNADDTSTAFILNSVRVYNDTLKSYKDGNKKEKFFLMQINAQILNQIDELRKRNGDSEGSPLENLVGKINNLGKDGSTS